MKLKHHGNKLHTLTMRTGVYSWHDISNLLAKTTSWLSWIEEEFSQTGKLFTRKMYDKTD